MTRSRQISVAAICVLLGPRALAQGETINVPSPNYPTIQAAIDAAVSGVDEVVVAPGTYNETVDFIGKVVTVRSSDGPDVTTIDGTGIMTETIRFATGERPDSVLDGFTLRHQNHHTVSVLGSECTILNSVFVGNRNTVPLQVMGWYDGSVVTPGKAFVKHCLFEDNQTEISGGAVRVDADGYAFMEDVAFLENRTTLSSANGGAIAAYEGARLTLTNCLFWGNETIADGGAVFADMAHVTVTNSTFVNNHSNHGSGGIEHIGFETAPPLTITNSIFWENTGEYLELEEKQFVSWGWGGEITVDLNYSIVQGLTGYHGGSGNSADDPLFVDAANGDLHLSASSPAIDAGNNNADTDHIEPGIQPLPETDLGGQARIHNSVVDMGAYECAYSALTLRIMPSPHFPWGTVEVEPNLPEYLTGTVVTLTAEPDEGRSFGFWTIRDAPHPGNPHDAIIDCNNPITLVMGADREVTAVFKRRECGDGVPPFLPMMLGVLGLFVWKRRKC